MIVDILEIGLPLHKILEAAERMDEIRPFTPRRLSRELGIEHRQAGRLVDLFIEMGLISLDRVPRRGYVPRSSPQDAALAVIDLLHTELCVGTVEVADDDDDLLDIDCDSYLDRDSHDELSFIFDTSDPLPPDDRDYLREAVETVCARELIGTSGLQRAMKIGYGRAAGLIDTLEELGIVGPDPGHKKGRQVLLSLEEALARLPAEED